MAGTLALPFTFAGATVAVPPILADLDTDLTTVRDYVNIRELNVGILANRPVAGSKGQAYLATDVAGGTLYLDDGAVWNQAAASVTSVAPSNLTSILASYALATL